MPWPPQRNLQSPVPAPLLCAAPFCEPFAIAVCLCRPPSLIGKRYDKDCSGSIDLPELEACLAEYFDEVASEFDELMGSQGRQVGPGLRFRVRVGGSTSYSWAPRAGRLCQG